MTIKVTKKAVWMSQSGISPARTFRVVEIPSSTLRVKDFLIAAAIVPSWRIDPRPLVQKSEFPPSLATRARRVDREWEA